jgi:hypothetical protein
LDVEETKFISKNFPNLELLSFLNVRAFPKDSKIGFDCSICCSIPPISLIPLLLLLLFEELLFNGEEDEDVVISAKYFIINLVVSVFPIKIK